MITSAISRGKFSRGCVLRLNSCPAFTPHSRVFDSNAMHRMQSSMYCTTIPRFQSNNSSNRKNRDEDSSLSSSLAKFKRKSQRILTGIRQFWQEFLEVRQLRAVKGKERPGVNGSNYNTKWTRRELSLAKKISHDITFVGLTAMIFIIPFGGVVVIAFSLIFPRYLTSHFWSERKRDLYILDDFMTKSVWRSRVSDEWIDSDISKHLKDLDEIWPSIASVKESRTYLRYLSAYHGVLNTHCHELFSSLLEGPIISRIIKRMIDKKLDNILFDDQLLLLENDIMGLSRYELQSACVDRMICSPNLSNSDMQSCLESWIKLDNKIRINKILLP